MTVLAVGKENSKQPSNQLTFQGFTPPRVDGKFLSVGGRRFLVRGVAYGTFAPSAERGHFPASATMSADFGAMAEAGINTVRTYTVPGEPILDAAAQHGLRVLVGIPWAQHVAFLDDAALVRRIRRDAVAAVRRLAAHQAALMFAIGNEIPPAVVRWYGQVRIERFLRDLYDEVKSAAPEALLTYVNFPPTEYLDLDCFDVCAFNVYLHREADLRAYLARLQHIAGPKPLLLAEAGADSLREGADGQARLTAMHLRAAFAEGACGAVAFSWTDEWWRGGHAVDDWAFGLVDHERQPKPALAAVETTFANVPFPPDEQAEWPKVSVVVCAYNAADTIDDCLTSLAALTYPDVEIIVVNDGSRDATGPISRRHDGVRVIDVPNGGLSAARNIGLAHAAGEIVAYTDADVRVDPDWLTYLVQPLLTRSGPYVVGVGGPNVVPHDDPWLAQCVARAPGGPTHVLIDDRIAEHVPGCNMAFRREALLGIGGFNPTYLRAGDDVDVCWRLQAKGLQIGFAGAALVWHHHRTTIEAFWRQQVGYGEGEAWLNVHHPEKFSGGGMLWRGRIYSSLPFVRSFNDRRVNTGVWGTAAFPSVYTTGSHPLQFLPHSAMWMALSAALVLVGGLVLPGRSEGGAWLLAAGAAGWMTTIVRCAIFAQRSELKGLPAISGLSPLLSRIVYRSTIAWLHLLQPLARMRGRIQGMWSLPHAGAERPVRQPSRAPLPSLRDARASGGLLAGIAAQRSFWSESWVSHPHLLTELAAALRSSHPPHVVEVDDGWHADRDLSVALGRWGWLHARVLVEEHAEGRCLLRTAARVRPSSAGVVTGLGFVALTAAGMSAANAFGSPLLSALPVVTALFVLIRGAWQTTRAIAVLDRALSGVTAAAGMSPLRVEPASPVRPRIALRPVKALRAIETAVLAVLVVGAAVGGVWIGREATATHVALTAEPTPIGTQVEATGGVAVGIAGDLFVADAQRGIIRRLRPRPPLGAVWTANDIGTDGPPLLGNTVPFDAAADIALAPNGDLYVADVRHNRIRRVVRSTGNVITVAGTGAAGFAGDGGAAVDAALHGPSAIAVAHNGDVYVADTLNDRIRVIVMATGVIRTIAGDGRPAGGERVGDDGPAVQAQLSRPGGLAVAANGDLYVADTGHNRVRRINTATGVITTIAGTGASGFAGDGGLATDARLAAPMGLALTLQERRILVYVADSLNDRVRVIEPDGRIATLQGDVPVLAPSRLAYHPAGWLYVKDASPDGVTALAASKGSHVETAAAQERQRHKPVRRGGERESGKHT